MADAVEKQFVERVKELLVSLPYDLKALFEATSDEDLPLPARRLATSAVVYSLSPTDPIPDHIGLVGFVDDVIAVRLALSRLLEHGGDAISDYPERFPEQFTGLDEDLALFRSFLGDAMGWLDARMKPDASDDMRYKGKSVDAYLADEEARQRLYEEALEFTTEYEIDEDAVERLTSGKPIRDAFEKRQQVEAARRTS